MGVKKLNFSDWPNHPQKVTVLVDLVLVDHMPPPDYRLIHIAPQLSSEMKRELAIGFQNTFGPLP